MERKIKRQSLVYGLTAILLASVTTAVILSIDLTSLDYVPGDSPISAPVSLPLSTFQSDAELKDFLRLNSKTQGPFWIYGAEDARLMGTRGLLAFDSALEASGVPSHSTTNIQVTGVDEADIVKVDDRGYLYVVSGNSVHILKAYPPAQAQLVSTIVLDDLHPIGIFVQDDKLAVLGSDYTVPTMFDRHQVVDIKTFLKVYDVENPSDPSLVRDFAISGSYFNSRMMGDYVYFVVSKAAYLIDETLSLPEISSDRKTIEIAPTEIRYFNGTDDYYQYTTFVAMNMMNTTEAPVYLPIMLGGTCNVCFTRQHLRHFRRLGGRHHDLPHTRPRQQYDLRSQRHRPRP